MFFKKNTNEPKEMKAPSMATIMGILAPLLMTFSDKDKTPKQKAAVIVDQFLTTANIAEYGGKGIDMLAAMQAKAGKRWVLQMESTGEDMQDMILRIYERSGDLQQLTHYQDIFLRTLTHADFHNLLNLIFDAPGE